MKLFPVVGGEVGDSERYCPVYLGVYWDVLLQTKNCWSMLQYARPQSYPRLIWVDAICINQEDHLEKECQVPMMGKIYLRCLRVIVYLGDQVVKPKEASLRRSYPARRDFSEFDDVIPGSLIDSSQLLKLKYFQRLWVIQELILAPSALIPAHGYEFRVGPLSQLDSRLPHPGDHEVSWMGDICTGYKSRSLLMLLQRTWASQATDPRDKIYGLLGLGYHVEGFRPDYSISLLHTYVGTILHLLLAEEFIEILTGATDQPAESELPSWLPNWNLFDMGKRLLSISQATPEAPPGGFRRRKRYIEEQIASLDRGYETLVDMSNDTFSAKTGLTASELWAIEKPYVDPLTLELTLSMVHVCKFTSRLTQIYRFDNHKPPMRVFKIEVSNCRLYICTSDIPLDLLVESGSNELFLLKKSHDVTLALFLRRLAGDGRYRLLQCNFCFDLFLTGNPSREPGFNRLPSNRDVSLNTVEGQQLSLLYGTVSKALAESAKDVERCFKESLDILKRTPSPDLSGVTSAIFEIFYQLVSDAGTSFLHSYIAFLLQCWPGCSARVEQNIAYMELEPNDWAIANDALFDPNRFVDFEVYVPSETKSPDSGTWHKAQLIKSPFRRTFDVQPLSLVSSHQTFMKTDAMHTMSLRVKAEQLRTCLESSFYYIEVVKKWYCDRILINGESVLRSEASWNTPDAFCYYPWPESLYEDGQNPGRVCKVTIV
ncbi:hypothetical protein FCULG_00008954 [Fusarium culmorum]|uniref:Heterokaryon incompatibility domain-containing protein n=1 Tax=Fusarium culmorum TaxID=5516 RepID=A0A2T4H292_FUSCU|nr:hypothetical protein FCULG_00008954 [Fusarium culmorum]